MRKPRPINMFDAFKEHVFEASVSPGTCWIDVTDTIVLYDPKQVRRIAAWLLRAADWMDARGKR